MLPKKVALPPVEKMTDRIQEKVILTGRNKAKLHSWATEGFDRASAVITDD